MVDYINRGPDKRPLGIVGAILQQVFSFPFKGLTGRPKCFMFGKNLICFPPFVAINTKVGNSWKTVRFGWRYDVNAKRYIADVIIKLNEENPLYY